MAQHVRLLICGKVQGVFFRVSAKRQAEILQIRGWISNNADGSVSAEAEGSAVALAQFVAWCKKGPEGAAVQSVAVEEGEAVGYTTFDIRR